MNRAPSVGTASIVGNAIAVADVQAVLRTILPNRVLDESREVDRESRVELCRVELLRHGANDARTAILRITRGPETVLGPMTTQGPCTLQICRRP